MLNHDVPLRAVTVRFGEMDRDELREVIAAVHSKFAERPREEVENVVLGAYRHLACSATVTSHLIPLTLNRSIRLMRALQDQRRENGPGEPLVHVDSLIQNAG